MNNIMWAVIALSVLALITALISYLQSNNAEDEVREDEIVENHSGGCCGQHGTCEKDSLLAAISSEIVYYDDEELDLYRGLKSLDYSEAQTNEFREILLTLQEDEVASWVRSLQLRDIAIPESLKPEVFLIIGEKRLHSVAQTDEDNAKISID